MSGSFLDQAGIQSKLNSYKYHLASCFSSLIDKIFPKIPSRILMMGFDIAERESSSASWSWERCWASSLLASMLRLWNTRTSASQCGMLEQCCYFCGEHSEQLRQDKERLGEARKELDRNL